MNTPLPDDADLLVPIRRGRTRLIVWLCFTAFAAIGNAPWSAKLISSLLMGLTIGVFPWTAINSQRITRGWSLFGWTIHTQNWKLSKFVSIDTGSESDDAIADPTGMLTPILFGGWSLFWPVFGWLLPWAGGPFRLSLRNLADEQITVWQGGREQHFQENLKTLERYTRLPIGRG